MTAKLMKRVFSRWYGASILVTLDMNKQECYAQLNHDYTSTQVVQSHKIQEQCLKLRFYFVCPSGVFILKLRRENVRLAVKMCAPGAGCIVNFEH